MLVNVHLLSNEPLADQALELAEDLSVRFVSPRERTGMTSE